MCEVCVLLAHGWEEDRMLTTSQATDIQSKERTPWFSLEAPDGMFSSKLDCMDSARQPKATYILSFVNSH